MRISVKDYNEAENKGRVGLSNRFIEAFAPDTFERVGYPTRISEDSEVIKYIDSMHDLRLRRYIENYKFAMKQPEFDTFKEITKLIYDRSKKEYGRGVLDKSPLLLGIHAMRKIKCIEEAVTQGCSQNTKEKPRIFEIGAGSGSLGGCCLKKGIPTYQQI